MRSITILSLLLLCSIKLTAQIPMIPIPIRNRSQMTPIVPTSKVLVFKNNKSGKTDTLTIGARVKLWFKSHEKTTIHQPILKSDFNRSTYFIESNLINITDSSIVLMRKSFNPLPIPLPINLKKDSLPDSFIDIRISDIIKFTSYIESVQKGVQNAVMFPAMSFFPEEFSTWPQMLYTMPANMVFMQLIGSSLYGARSVNDEDDKYSLYIHETGFLDVSVQEAINDHKEDEWQYEKSERLDDLYIKIESQWMDKVLSTNKGNKIISLHIGSLFMPNYIHTDFDASTQVKIYNKKRVFGFSTEHFVSEKFRIGTEMQMHATQRSFYMQKNGSMGGGSGFIFSNFTFFKLQIGNGLYSKNYRNRLKTEIAMSNPNKYDEFEKLALKTKKTKLLAEPKPYFLIGAGAVNTTLIRMKGSQSNLSMKEYEQKKFSIEGGFGLFSRVSKRMTYDMSLKYIWSPKYSPSIGSVHSYSGIKLQLNVGYMIGTGLSKMKKELKLIRSKY